MFHPTHKSLCVVLAALIGVFSALGKASMDLSGEWRLRLDPADKGTQAGWPAEALAGRDRITLPTTTDCAGFGFALDTNTMSYPCPFPVTTRFPGVKEPTRADEHGYLVRRHLFVGPAWYEREIEIPAEWKGRAVVLRIERAMWKTDAWLDGRSAGSCDSLVAEHRHELGILAPGRHRLTVRVDNRMIHNLSTITHAYGPETQSRWNGMVGRIVLEAADAVSVKNVAVFPAADRRSARLVVTVANLAGTSVPGTLRGRLLAGQGTAVLAESRIDVNCPTGLSTHEVSLPLAQAARAWDEFSPVRHRAEVRLETATGHQDETAVSFGFRHIERADREIRVNGRRVFLRGTLDCCVYPETGHPPMTIPEWERIMGVIKAYGFNHVRYHTWCPPEAAFEAADRLGLYLQPEAPAWVDDWVAGTVTRPRGIGRDEQVASYLRAEMRRISEAYGNHPSFVMFTIGNEFGMSQTDWPRVAAMVEEIKQADPRRLYSGCTARRHLAADDFWVTHDSGAGTRGIGPPHTDWDFSRAAEASPVPLLAHETGQMPVFPDYEALLPKFRGPLLPLNLERYRRALAAHGLAGQVKDFVRASARFQLTQYKAEHEGMLRTRGYAGYQLLMLNDFTGQSEALVGILDPFWESKGVVSPQEVRSWNAPTVLLARFPKYVWRNDETFRARLEMSHFGAGDVIPGNVTWALTTHEGERVNGGKLEVGEVVTGQVSSLGEIAAPLTGLGKAVSLTLEVRYAGVENRWNLWVYPAGGDEPEPPGVLVVRTLDETALARLRTGGRVVLLAHGLKNCPCGQDRLRVRVLVGRLVGQQVFLAGAPLRSPAPGPGGISERRLRRLAVAGPVRGRDDLSPGRRTRRFSAGGSARARFPLQCSLGPRLRGPSGRRAAARVRL